MNYLEQLYFGLVASIIGAGVGFSIFAMLPIIYKSNAKTTIIFISVGILLIVGSIIGIVVCMTLSKDFIWKEEKNKFINKFNACTIRYEDISTDDCNFMYKILDNFKDSIDIIIENFNDFNYKCNFLINGKWYKLESFNYENSNEIQDLIFHTFIRK